MFVVVVAVGIGGGAFSVFFSIGRAGGFHKERI